MIKSRWRYAGPLAATIRPPFGGRANAATERSISAVSSCMLTRVASTLSDGAIAWMTLNWALGLAASRMTAARVTPGAICFTGQFARQQSRADHVRCGSKADIAVPPSMTFAEAGGLDSTTWSFGLQNIVARSDKRWWLGLLQIPSRPNLASVPSQIARARSPDVL